MVDGGNEGDEIHRLDELRRRISEVDDQLIQVIGERRAIAVEIGRIKEALGLPVMDPGREARVVRDAAARARQLGVDEEMTRDVIWRIISSARSSQRSGGDGPTEGGE